MSISMRMRWARVEYQLDLRTPQRPVPLGVVVLTDSADRVQSILAGKAPRAGFTPEELKTVGPLGRSQLEGWAAAMARDLLGAIEKREDPLETLASIWCWNLRLVIESGVAMQPGQRYVTWPHASTSGISVRHCPKVSRSPKVTG